MTHQTIQAPGKRKTDPKTKQTIQNTRREVDALTYQTIKAQGKKKTDPKTYKAIQNTRREVVRCFDLPDHPKHKGRGRQTLRLTRPSKTPGEKQLWVFHRSCSVVHSLGIRAGSRSKLSCRTSVICFSDTSGTCQMTMRPSESPRSSIPLGFSPFPWKKVSAGKQAGLCTTYNQVMLFFDVFRCCFLCVCLILVYAANASLSY